MADEGFRVLKGTIETLLDELGLADRATLEPADYPFLGAAAAWRIGQHAIGYLGELAEEAVELYDLRGTPCVAELDLDALVPDAVLDRRFAELPRFPTVERDLAIVVGERVTWEQILAAVHGAGAGHLESVSFGEVYRGQQVERGTKSVLFSLVYRAPDRTLTGGEVQASQDKIVAALAETLGAALRS